MTAILIATLLGVLFRNQAWAEVASALLFCWVLWSKAKSVGQSAEWGRYFATAAKLNEGPCEEHFINAKIGGAIVALDVLALFIASIFVHDQDVRYAIALFIIIFGIVGFLLVGRYLTCLTRNGPNRPTY